MENISFELKGRQMDIEELMENLATFPANAEVQLTGKAYD